MVDVCPFFSGASQQVRRLFWGGSFFLGLVAAGSFALPARSADRINFDYPPFGEFTVNVRDLEIFANEGRITDDFAYYAQRATPQDLAALRDILNRRFMVSPVTVSQFTYSSVGETILKRLGLILRTETRENGFFAIRAAFLLAASDPQGMTILNMLRRFPSRTIHLNLPLSLSLANDASQLFRRRDILAQALQQEAIQQAEANPLAAGLKDIRQPGPLRWRKQSFSFVNPERREPVPADLYLPIPAAGNLPPFPLVVLSHGVASDRTTLAYLAQHLASYGIAAAVLEHPRTSAVTIERFIAGFDTLPGPEEFFHRPLDIKSLLDTLEKRSQTDPTLRGLLNLKQVGLMGHSLGGYTVLALAGATLNLDHLRRVCSQDAPEFNTFNISTLLQCQGVELPETRYNLRDDRIKAVLALNSIGSDLFSESGFGQIQIPTMLVSGSHDYFAPAIAEQIYPFTWLKTPDRYLVLLQPGTHFSLLSGSTDVLELPTDILGPDGQLVRPAFQALSVAFFKVHLSNQAPFRPYLTAGYAQSVSQAPYSINLLTSLTLGQINRAMLNASP